MWEVQFWSSVRALRPRRCRDDLGVNVTRFFFPSLIELRIIPSAASVLTSARPDEITEKKERDNN